MRTGSLVPLLTEAAGNLIESKDQDSASLLSNNSAEPNTPALTLNQFTFFNNNTPVNFVRLIEDVKMHFLEWLTPAELTAFAHTCSEYHFLTRHASIWTKFLKPEFHKVADAPNHEALQTFRTQGQSRLAAFTFLGLNDKEGTAAFMQSNTAKALMKLLCVKYPRDTRTIITTLAQPHIQNLLRNKSLTLKEVFEMDNNAVIILGYSWIKTLCQTGKAKLALDLTQYHRSLIHSDNTRENITHPVVQELLRLEKLALNQAVYLTAEGRDNLNIPEVRQRYINGELSYEELCSKNSRAEDVLAPPPATNSCCSIM